MSSHVPKASLFGFDFCAARHVRDVAEDILQDAGNGMGVSHLITPNASQIVYYHERRHRDLKRFYTHCRYILPDGMPIVWLSRLKGPRRLYRLPGSDLFPVLWKRIKAGPCRAVFVLANEDMAMKFREEHPQGRFIVPHMFEADDDAYISELAAEVAAAILETSAEFVFLGLGYPKQEKLGIQIARELEGRMSHAALILLLGASFEFYFGLKPRAPHWMQRYGLEWFHRFLQEPARLWKRYTVDNARFVWLALRELAGIKSRT